MLPKNIIVALDVADYEAAMRLAEKLPPELCRVKVGKSLFTRCGPKVIRALHDSGHDVFLDLKFHDIPNTVAEAVEAAADLGVWMVNVHAQGGSAMLQAAKRALAGKAKPPLLIAVTILTSMDAESWQSLGNSRSIAEQVEFLTALTAEAGLDGVVCSALEAGQVKSAHGEGFLTVTPGIRPSWAARDDQARIVTPAQACIQGSDYLVIGRPVSKADDPYAALVRIIDELTTNSEVK
ncbi:orotidine-5'-phosphate decarboxylase [Cardiobacteriaceae bacterium TAE3-ERU3]|nr:orotidine-5'-phosphate decarboxylase [Cardiobacteriaceae bacterium TAE3-ERU3]